MPDNADANFTAIAYQAEPSWGVAPDPIALTELRFTKFDFAHDKATVVSAEVRDDAQIADIVEVGVQAAGGFEGELSFSEYQPFIAAAIRGELVEYDEDLTVDMNSGTGVITGLAGDFDDIVVGQYVRLYNAATPGNNGAKKVTAKAVDGSTITVSGLTANATADAVTIKGKYVRNGILKPSFLIEKQLVAGSAYVSYPGYIVDQFTLNLTSRQIATVGFTFLGQRGISAGATIDAAGGYAPATTDQVMNASSHVSSIKEAGVVLAANLKAIRLQTKANLRGQDAVGQKGLSGVGTGAVDVTGMVNAYFSTRDLLDKMIGHTYSSLEFTITDGAGNAIVFTMPYVNFSTGEVPAEGINTDLMQECNFQAIRHPTNGYTIQVDFLPATA